MRYQGQVSSGRSCADRIIPCQCSDRMRADGLKLKEDRFRLDVRKSFFTMRMVKH